MVNRVDSALSGLAPQERRPVLVRSELLYRAPIRARVPGPPMYYHDIDVTLPVGLDPLTLTWDELHTSYGAMIDTADAMFERCRFYNLGDGVSIQGTRSVIKDCWFKEMFDDAIQLDHKLPATIENCVMDGVHIGISAESSIRRTAPARIDVLDTVIRLRPQKNSYKPDKYNPIVGVTAEGAPIRRDPEGQHGGFFKENPDDPNTPAFHLHHVVLMANQEPGYRTLAPPKNCTGTRVTLVGVDNWPKKDLGAWYDLEASGAIEHLGVVAPHDYNSLCSSMIEDKRKWHPAPLIF